jgi:hypothetical protein
VQLSCEHVPAYKQLEHGLTAACAAAPPPTATPQLLHLIGEADRTAIFYDDGPEALEQRDRGRLRFQAYLREPLQHSLHKGGGFGGKTLVPATRGDLHFAPLRNLRQAI